MKKTLLAVLVSLLAGPALADVEATSASGSNSSAGAISGSQSASGSYSNTGAATAGNAQSMTLNQNVPEQQQITTRYRGGYDVRNVPDVTTILPGATVPCFASIGGSVAGAGFGVGFASGLIDTDCTRRETARSLASLGKTDAAVRLFCDDVSVAKLLPECAAPVTQPAGPVVSYDPVRRETKVVANRAGFVH